jgi:hypothetical protein
MKNNNVIDFDKWKIDHDLLFGVCILGNSYLELTAINALKARHMKLTRDEVALFQEANDLIDDISNNRGVIDVPTFVNLVSVYEDSETLIPIITELNMSIDKYKNTLNPLDE